MGIFIQEVWIDASDNVICGESDVYESCYDAPGEVYKALQKEYGRCTGKEYIDGPDGKSVHVGWVFQKRKQYEDCNKTYLAETWVTLHEKPPTKTVTNHYFELDK